MLNDATAAKQIRQARCHHRSAPHRDFRGAAVRSFADDTGSPTTEADSTGNSVSLEEEMIKVADTQAQYPGRRPISIPRRINMMRTAIGKPGG